MTSSTKWMVAVFAVVAAFAAGMLAVVHFSLANAQPGGLPLGHEVGTGTPHTSHTPTPTPFPTFTPTPTPTPPPTPSSVNNLLLNPGGGNVGIGTFNPTEQLHLVSSNSDILLETLSDTAVAGVDMVRSRAGKVAVVIGDPLAALNGRGFDGTTYQPAARIRFEVDGTPGPNDMPGRIVFSTVLDGSTNRIDRMTIKNDGRVGIGTITPTTTLHVNGVALADAHMTPSSRNLKTNIEPLADALDQVQRLRGVSFDWKDGGRQDIGLIAEEVAEVIPEVVGEDAQSIDYSRLVAVLIEALKEQQDEIDQLKSKVSKLESIK